jgi:hypothetical protein
MRGRIVVTVVAMLWLLALAGTAQAASPPAAGAIKGYLPAGGSFAAEYVVIERDPNFDVYSKRIRAAMEANAAWLTAYRQQHTGKGALPYHPNFGVPEADYIRYQSPANQFREVSRQRIRVDKQESGNTIQLRFQGEKLLLAELQIDTATPAAKTPRGALEFRESVDLERASLPPAAYRGVSFNTPQAAIIENKQRESVLVGRLKTPAPTGIIHYGLNTPGKAEMAYVIYPLPN